MGVPLDVRVLGPLEVRAADVRVPLGGPRQRTLLGLLALRAPGVVSRAHLIDGIWGERPPGSATKTLHAHVAYVRRALSAAGAGEVLVTRPPGYALAVADGAVDARRFEELVRRGRAAGSPAEAAEPLRAALALWQGTVLADCPLEDWARAEAAGLQETRRSAAEDLCAADLALGRHADVAADLETLLGQDPLRERLWELLMAALHRAGRPADALAAYRRARTALAGELGIEPGPTLRRMEAAILNGEEPTPGGTPTAAAPTAPGGSPATAVPAVPDEPPAEAPLPVPLTRLIGRSAEIAEVGALVAERRLVTVTGVGGCGKTRLAIAVADKLGGGARFVDLTAVTGKDLVVTAVAAALGVPERPDRRPLDGLIRRLRPHALLLVLDNCEHLADACADLAAALLTACPHLRVLATSRIQLGVPGEVAWPLAPLPAPAGRVSTLADVRGLDAVELFLDRAAVPAVRALADTDAPALAAICAGLDGLPLAIELAAARTAVLTLPDIAARIHDPALLRRSGPPGAGRRAAERHHALDAAMAWSYQLLDPTLQAAFRRLAVFAGGFTLDAVEAVVPGARGRAVDLVGDLVARSLVVVDRTPAGARYRLLETIRQYARERLAETADECASTRHHHADHYRDLALDAGHRLHGPDLDRLLDHLAAEHENLRAALAWFAAHGAAHGTGDDELRLAAALARYCHLRGRYRDGRQWLDDALARHSGEAPAGPSPDLAKALHSAAFLAFFECDYPDATAYGERSLSAQRASGDAVGVGRSLSMLASVDRERGDYDRSLARYREAADTYRAAGDDAGVADTLQMAGFTSWLTGDLPAARAHLDDALARFDVAGDPEGVASARVHLAAVACYAGEPARARWLAEDALARFRTLAFKEGIAWALNIAGLVEDRPDRAADLLRAALDIHREVGDRWRAASVLEALAGVVPDAAQAVELLAEASTIRRTLGTPTPPVERPARDATEARLRAALTDPDFYTAWARGEAR